MKKSLSTALVALTLLGGTAVPHFSSPVLAQEALQGAPMDLPVHPEPLTFEADGKTVAFDIEIADTTENRARGLMFRTEFPDDRGMLFVFEETRQVGFWMKNTPLPLDLVFIDENGVVIAVLPGEPQSTASIGPDGPSRFVLELNRGTAERVGLEAGMQLTHPEIQAAGAG